MHRIFHLFLLGAGTASVLTAASPLLNRAAERWLAEGDRWAFTVHVREFDNAEVKEDRVERFDPSKPGWDRWELVTVDGRAPTAARRLAWAKAKARKHRFVPKSLAEYVDLDNATVVGTTPIGVRYHLPLRSNRSWLFPMDHVDLTVTVNRTTAAIEQVEAGMREPFRVALGLARVVDVDFDLQMNPSRQRGAESGPASAHPAGLAHVVLSRLGERIEYTWSDFHRVASPPGHLAASPPAD
jgi:hypothetical protein